MKHKHSPSHTNRPGRLRCSLFFMPVVASLAGFGAASTHATDYTWFSGTGAWDNASLWNPHFVPSLFDTAIMYAGVATLSDDVLVGGLNLVNSANSNPVIEGSGTLKIDILNWGSGTMRGNGTTTVYYSATIGDGNTSGFADLVLGSKTLGVRTLNLTRATTFQAGTLSLNYGSTVNNTGFFYSTGKVYRGVTSDNAIRGGFDAPDYKENVFNNSGTFIQDASGHATSINTIFNNTGSVEVRSGSLIIRFTGGTWGPAGAGGMSSGSWSILQGTTVSFGTGSTAGRYTFDFMEGSISNAGTIRIMDSSGIVNIGAGVAYSGGGSILIGDVNVTGGPGGRLNVNAGATIAPATLVMGSGYLGGGGTVNAGSIDWNGGIMDGNGITNVSGSTLIRGGAHIGLENDARILNLHGTTTFRSDSMSINSGSTVNNFGTLTSMGWAQFDFVRDNRIAKNWGTGVRTFNNVGTFIQDSGTSRTTVGDIFTGYAVGFNNTGTVHVKSGSLQLNSLANFDQATQTLSGGTWQVGSGTLAIDMGAGASIQRNAASIILDGPNAAIRNSNGAGSDGLAGFSDNLAAGRFELRNGAAYSAAGAFTNAGHVVVGAGSGFTTAAGTTYTQTAGSTTFAGTLGTSSVELYGGLLSITGTVAGSVNNYGGTVDPPGVPGKLTILGDFTQHAGGKLLLQIGGTERGVTYDWLSVDGTATLGGELEIVFLNGYVPAPGTRFDLMSYSNVFGNFDTTRISGISGAGESFAFGSDGISLTVNPVPEPETYAMMLAGLGLMGFAARRRSQRDA